MRTLKRAATGDVAIDTATVGLGAGLTAALAAVGNPVAGVLATAAATTLAGVIKRLTHREAGRVAAVTESAAAQILERVAGGCEARADIDTEEAQSLLEGVLLQARRSYEEKKVPLLANLLAAAPFTGTPLSNLIAPLVIIERLSYRQLCILSLIPGYDPNDYLPLTDATVGELYAANPVGEVAQGVLADLTDLIRQGLVVQSIKGVEQAVVDSQVRPKFLRLAYPALLLANGARLRQTIPVTDVAELRELLSHPTPDERVRHPPIAIR